MDKRWIVILIILIIGIGCLYFIVDSSTTLGRATVNVNAHEITVPPQYNVAGDGKAYVDLINRETYEHIIVKDVGKGDLIESEMNKRADSLAEDGNISSIEKKNITVACEILPAIHYEKIDDECINYIVFVKEDGHTFSIECKDFGDEKAMVKDISFIRDTLTRDFKQKQTD